MTNELIADGIYRVSGMETSLKNGAWVSDAGTYLVTDQTKLADIPEARPGDIAFTAGYGHIWQLDVDSTTWVELPKTAAGTAATQAAASATAAAGSASAAAASASQAQTVAASIPADYTSLSNSVVDLKSALNNGQTEVALALVEGALDGSGQVISAQNKWITNDYMELSKLACLVNNTSGNVYIDYYKYSANSYSFLGYDTVEAGSTKYVAKNGGATHIRLYINNNSTSVILTRYTDTFIRQEQQKVYITVFNEDNNFTVENGSLRVSTPEGGYGEYGTETDSLAKFRVRTSFIPVIAGTRVKIIPTIPSYFGYCYYIYDEMKRAISVYDAKWSTAIGPNGDNTIISEGAYIRLLFHTVPDFTPITGDAMLLNVKNCISVTTEIPTIVDNTVKYTDGYYLNNVGELVETEKAATTALITVVPGEKAIAVMRTKTGTKWIAGAIYDQSKNFIKRIASTDYETDGDYYVMKMILPIPMNGFVGYVRFSFGANYESFNVTTGDRMPLAKYDVKSANHRGYQNYAPENTLIAFKLSKAVGFDWVEFDVQFTSDNMPVVLHDRSINRTAVNADGTAISGTVNIDSISYEQALGYDFGMAFSSIYAGTKIPTFDETIKLCKYLGLNARIELKEETVTTGKIDSLVSIVEKYGMQNNVEWASFSHPLLNYIVENHPNYGVVYIQSTIDSTLINTIDSALRITKKVSCAVSKNNLAENFAQLSETGVMIDIYTVETDADIISADSHVFSFTTNMPIAGEVLHNRSIVV